MDGKAIGILIFIALVVITLAVLAAFETFDHKGEPPPPDAKDDYTGWG